uniref:Sugar transporter n=1 Tax=Nilaparvata lugens TaxID=108931 RepID=A0A0A8JAE5_NILLU|nr:sugar transporter [Nilaparvata lugens]
MSRIEMDTANNKHDAALLLGQNEENSLSKTIKIIQLNKREESKSCSKMIMHFATNQYIAGLIGSISVMVGATCIAWVAPILHILQGPDSPVPMTSDQTSWMVSFIEIGPFFTPTISGILSDRIGRKPCIYFSVFLYLASWVLMLSVYTVPALYAARTLQGMALGITFTIVPMYLGEIAENHIRGALTTLFQTLFHVGLLFEYCIGPYFSYETVLYVNAALSVLFFGLFYFQVESPYYYLIKNNEYKALLALTTLRGNQPAVKIEQELREMKAVIEKEMSGPSKVSFSDVFKTRADRKALFLVVVITVTKAYCGLLAILSYATEAFRVNDEGSVLGPNEYTILIGLQMVIVVGISAKFVDSLGRRPLILASSFGCFVCNVLVCVYFYMNQYSSYDLTKYHWLIFSCFSLFAFFFSFGLGPVALTLQSELFPTNTRGIASSFCALSFTVASFLCLKLYQVFTDHYGLYLNYLLFSIFCMIGFILTFIFLPETKGKSFSEIRLQLSGGEPTDVESSAAKS